MFKKLALLALLPLSLSAMEQAPQQPAQPTQQAVRPQTESRSDRAMRFGLIGKAATYAAGVFLVTGATTVATVAAANPVAGIGAGMWMSGAWFPAVEIASNKVAVVSALVGAATYQEEQKEQKGL